MTRIKFIIIILATLCGAFAVDFVLRSESALLTHPKGIIAERELHLIITSILLMLIIVVPTAIWLFATAWKYRSKNSKATYDPDDSQGVLNELLLWVVPSVPIAIMILITWHATHELDQSQPIKSDVKPLKIQVVALDWKWLFIYPEQQIASLNYFQFPENTPIELKLSADGSPMNSFWLAELSGQIYAMTGMVTPLHIMAHGPGVYTGRAAEINGDGYSDMTFIAKSSTRSEFDAWVAIVKQSPLQLTNLSYNDITKRTKNDPVTLYSYVEKDLFNQIVMKYMHTPSTL